MSGHVELDQKLAVYRPHVVLAAFVVGLVGCELPVPALGGLAACGLLVATGGRSRFLALAIALATLAGALLGTARLAAIDRSELVPMAGREVVLSGWVVKRERAVHGAAFRLRATAVGPAGDPAGETRPLRELVQVRTRSMDPGRVPGIGDEVRARGDLAVPERRPGDDFDYPAYLRRAGVHVVLHANEVAATGHRRGGLTGAVDSVRRRAERGVTAGLPPRLAALAAGMVLGEDERIDSGMREEFNRSGLAHLLAVSGQNVTLLAILAWPLLALAGLGRRGRLVGTLALIALYVPLTGAGPSIVRAGTMGAAGVVAALAGRPASRWYALLLAAAVSHAIDPRAWQDAGWQLSFAAVVGIFAGSKPLRRRLGFLPDTLAEGTALTVAATLATAPLMSFHFGQVSLASLPANVAALPAVAPVMWIGMLSAGVAQVAVWPATLLNALAAYAVAYVAAVAHACAASRLAVWKFALPSAAALVAVYALFGAALAARRLPGISRRRSSPRARWVVAAALAALALAGLVAARGESPHPPNRFTATFLDVGQGDATLLQAPGGHAVLIDGGPPGSGVVDGLHRRGVTALDVVVLTHAQEDHQGGLEEVLDRIPVRLLLDGGAGARNAAHARIVALALRRGTRMVTGAAGERLRAGGLLLEVLSPPLRPPGERPDPGEDPNQRAIVLVASYAGVRIFLPADAESDVTSGLSLPRVDVLKVAHHGSADEGLPDLLQRLHPSASVIEVGAGNRYGHPAPEALRALTVGGGRVFRTDREGDVRLVLGPRGPVMTPER